jgi:hypothetical protein
MAACYVIRKDATGFTVSDNFTGEPLIQAMDPQPGLSDEDARQLAELFNRCAEQGDRGLQK